MCSECFRFLYERLSLSAKKILESLDNKSYNKNQIMLISGLQITAANYAIQELLGAGMIEVRPYGNHKMIRLSNDSINFLGVRK